MDIRTRPVVVDLASPEYDLIIGNRDLLRMGICLRNLPSPTKLRDHIDRQHQEEFTATVGTDVQHIYELSQHLETLLNNNLAIDFHQKCTLEDATVHLNLTDNIVKHIKSGKRNFVAQQYETAVSETIQEWLKDGVIQKLIGPTPLNISLLAVRQLDPAGETKKIRVCLDFRALNTALTMDNTVLPTIDDLLHKVGGHKIYSSLDLKSGYNQLPLAKPDQKYIAFHWKVPVTTSIQRPLGSTYYLGNFTRWSRDCSQTFLMCQFILMISACSQILKNTMTKLLQR